MTTTLLPSPPVLKTEGSGTLVPYLGRLLIDDAFTITAHRDDVPYTVTMAVEVRDGVPGVVELVCTQRRGGPPVDGRGLRDIPVHELLAEGIRARARDSQRRRAKPLTDGDLARPSTEPTLSRQMLTDALLAEVAEVYRSAVVLGRPVETVAEYFSSARPGGRLPRNTARRWVSEARKRGFLEPSKRSETEAARESAAVSDNARENSKAR